MQAPTDASAGTLVGVAQFVRDHNVPAPPLAVGRMAIDADKIDNGVTKGKAVIVLHTWKDHLWAIGSKAEPPELVSVSASAAGGEETGTGDGVADDGAGGEGADGGQGTHPTEAKVVETEEEKLTPEGNVPGFSSGLLKKTSLIDACITAPPEVSARLRAALLQALRTTLADIPSSAFPMPTTTLYTVHILPARPFTPTAATTTTTPVDIKHSTFKSLSAFLRIAEKGGLLKLKDARPDVVVVAVYPTHADVVAHRLHHTIGEQDERRRRTEEREAQQAAAAANAEKSTTVTKLWKPHLGTLPLFVDLKLEYSPLSPPLFLLPSLLMAAAELSQHKCLVHSRRGQVRDAHIHRETRPHQPRRTTIPQRQRRCGFLRCAVWLPKRKGRDSCPRIC